MKAIRFFNRTRIFHRITRLATIIWIAAILIAAAASAAAAPAAAQDEVTDRDDLDNRFGRHGIAYVAGDIHPEGMALQPDGKIVVVGSLTSSDSTSDMLTLRYDDRGRLDRAFAGDGSMLSGFGPGDEWGTLPLIQSDRRILSIGWGIWEGAYGLALARFLPDGQRDSSLDGDGKLWIGLPIGRDFHVGGALQQPDGKIVIVGAYISDEGGETYPTRFLVRIAPDGTPDASFGANGVVNHHFAGSSGLHPHIYDAALAQDGSIIIAGALRTLGGEDAASRWMIAVYHPNGDFSRSIDLPEQDPDCARLGCRDNAGGVEVQPDGKIVIAGAHTVLSGPFNLQNQSFHVLRFNPNWSLDTTFSGDGQASTAIAPRLPGGARDRAFDLVIMPGGRILVGGTSAGDVALARFYGNGELDRTFGRDGALTTDLGAQDTVQTLRLQSDDRLMVLATRANALAGATRAALLRYRISSQGAEPTPEPPPDPVPDFGFTLSLPVIRMP